MTIDNENWIEAEAMGYDELRYSTDHPDNCQECGARLDGGADRAGAVLYCPKCKTTVMII